MSLRTTHRGYAYQDLLTAIRLVDVLLGRANHIVVDEKAFEGDLFDDITTEWNDAGRERLQIKHTSHERDLAPASFSAAGRGLRLDLVIASAAQDLRAHPGTSYRIVVRDRAPQDPRLTEVLVPIDPSEDPGPVLVGLGGARMRFDVDALRSKPRWAALLSQIEEEELRRVCAVLLVDVGVLDLSVDMYDPGPAEQALLRRVTNELGVGRPPNQHRAPEEIAMALIETAKSARSGAARVTVRDLAPRLSLAVDFGAVQEGHPVERAVEITRPGPLDTVTSATGTAAENGGTVMVIGAPGAGKSWLSEQLADRLQKDEWIVARHHCWLGASDVHREQRVLVDTVLGSLLHQLEIAAPEAVRAIRPRFAATRQTLQAALTQVRHSHQDRRIALIVDGLDHVTRVQGRVYGGAFGDAADPSQSLVDELAAVELPAGVTLILASQPGDHLANLAKSDTSISVSVPPLQRPEVQQLAERLGVLAAISANDAKYERDAVVDLLLSRSRGNALYATYLCRQALTPTLEGGVSTQGTVVNPLEQLRAVPPSAADLDDYYTYLVRGLAPHQQDAVALLAVCDFAVSAEELQQIFPMSGPSLPAALRAVAPITTQQPGIGGLKIHHESFSRFIRERSGDSTWLAFVRTAAADWLVQRGFFVDTRAFRHLPSLLVDLQREDELAALIQPDFLSRAIAAFQPPSAVMQVLIQAARSSAIRCDWNTLVRCLELRRAAETYEQEGIPDTIVDYADVLVGVLGKEVVAASLVYDGAVTVAPRWGLQLCAAIDAAGAAAPWQTYLTAWENADDEHVQYGRVSEDNLFLAEQRGHLRLHGVQGERINESGSVTTAAQRIADGLAQDALPPLTQFLPVLTDAFGAPVLLDAAPLIQDPVTRADVLLHLADAARSGVGGLPTPATLATEAWACAPGRSPLRALEHGVSAVTLADHILGHDVDASLRSVSEDVLRESHSAQATAVDRWLTQLTLAHTVDRQALVRLHPALSGPGFYRAWLRFAATTTGLQQDVAAGVVTEADASQVVRISLEQLAQAADPFTGRPRAVDLGSMHRQVHAVVEAAVALLRGPDLEPALGSLNAISNGTTTSLMGLAGAGPLITTDLLAMLSRTVDQTGAEVVHRMMSQLRAQQTEGRTLYSENAAFELEMARISLAAGDLEEARRCWHGAARYMAGYGSHKDSTIDELLDPLPDLASVDLPRARICLARVRPLTYLVWQHTDGRGTSSVPFTWWRHLADMDPRAAADLAAEALLAEPGLEDARSEAAHLQLLHRLLTEEPDAADPIVLAALRISAGPAGRHLDDDIHLLERLAGLPDHDAARGGVLLPLVANAITATYDDRPFQSEAQDAGPQPSAALYAAAQELGGESAPAAAAATPGGSSTPSSSPPQPEHSSMRGRGDLLPFLVGGQRPTLPAGASGVVTAIRDFAGRPYDADPNAPRWSVDALTAAIGWRVLATAAGDGIDAACRLLHQVADELQRASLINHHAIAAVLTDLAHGLELRRDNVAISDVAAGDPRSGGMSPADVDRLLSLAYTLAFTTIKGRGGWTTFAGRERLDLWQRAVELDAHTAESTLARQVAVVVAGPGYATLGVTQALITAFARKRTEPSEDRANASDDQPLRTTGPDTAFTCWEAAFGVIAHRLPGRPQQDGPVYEPTDEAVGERATAAGGIGPDPAGDDEALTISMALLTSRDLPASTQAESSTDLDTALARLALAVLAMPARADKRRALTAASILFAARPTVGQAAATAVLAADLGAGPLTWLLSILQDSVYRPMHDPAHGSTEDETSASEPALKSGTTQTGSPENAVSDALAAQLTVLARSDLLSVRVIASEILTMANRPVPSPPATPAHEALVRGVADSMRKEEL